MAGDDVLNAARMIPNKIVAVVLIKFVVLHRDNRVDQIAAEVDRRNGFAVLDIDLAKDLVVPIENHAGRFHLLEMREIEPGGLLSKGHRMGMKASKGGEEEDDPRTREGKTRDAHTTGPMVAGELRRREIIHRHAARAESPKCEIARNLAAKSVKAKWSGDRLRPGKPLGRGKRARRNDISRWTRAILN